MNTNTQRSLRGTQQSSQSNLGCDRERFHLLFSAECIVYSSSTRSIGRQRRMRAQREWGEETEEGDAGELASCIACIQRNSNDSSSSSSGNGLQWTFAREGEVFDLKRWNPACDASVVLSLVRIHLLFLLSRFPPLFNASKHT